MAKIVWMFNEEDTIEAGNATPFSFKLERYKDDSTHEESLKISSFLNGSDNGFIVTTIYNLEKDITQLMKYGVVLSAIEFKDLHKEIQKNYLKLKTVPISLDSDPRFDELIDSIKEYAKGNKDLIGDGLFKIPVIEFNELSEDCGFYGYEIKALRGQLNSQDYIHTSGGRFAIVARVRNKTTRVIAFKLDKLGIKDPDSDKDNQAKESGSDE